MGSDGLLSQAILREAAEGRLAKRTGHSPIRFASVHFVSPTAESASTAPEGICFLEFSRTT